MISTFPIAWQEKLDELGIETFTPIQEHVFPLIQNKNNVLGISPTGTGKTLAYLFPALLNLKPKKAQQLLILAPNTELAGQIFDVVKQWAEPLGLSSQLFISGSSQKRQIERLKKGPEIIIGTPGRLFELVKLKKIKMTVVETIVLDEFDELMSDSQFHFVKNIMTRVAKDYQMIYMSATNKVTSNELIENLAIVDLSEQKLDNIQHFYISVEKRQKIELLRKLSNVENFRGLVFFNQLADLGASEEKLQYNNVSAVSLASDVNVKFRKTILEKFKDYEISLLLATDLVARGIDIDQLDYVVNFDLPRDKEAYTHRSGRTGRMNRAGHVITFITHPEELKQLKKIVTAKEIVLKDRQFFQKD